jgi:hypothetical protein
LWNQGEPDEARALLGQVRGAVDQQFSTPMTLGDTRRGLWYDWLFARIMMREATMLIGEEP